MSLRADLEGLRAGGYTSVDYVLDGNAVESFAHTEDGRVLRGATGLTAVASDLGRLLGTGFPVNGALEHLSGRVVLDRHVFELEVTPGRGRVALDAVEVCIHLREGRALPPGLGRAVEWVI